MGHREVRAVAEGWQHPKDADGRHVPLYSRRDLLRHQEAPDADEIAGSPEDYMPPIPEGAPYRWALYETTTEGTPASPPFATLEELADWCAPNATAYADQKWTRDQWLKAFRDGTLAADTVLYAG